MAPSSGRTALLPILLSLLLLGVSPGAAQVEKAGRSTGLPLPRFVSLGSDRVNVRYGPGKEFEIAWVYARQGLPVRITAEFDTWRKIEDYEGATGWIHSSLLSNERTIMIRGEVRELKRTPEAQSRAVLRAEPGVIGRLFDCEDAWCQVEVAGRRGWLMRSEFFGTVEGEEIG